MDPNTLNFQRFVGRTQADCAYREWERLAAVTSESINQNPAVPPSIELPLNGFGPAFAWGATADQNSEILIPWGVPEVFNDQLTDPKAIADGNKLECVLSAWMRKTGSDENADLAFTAQLTHQPTPTGTRTNNPAVSATLSTLAGSTSQSWQLVEWDLGSVMTTAARRPAPGSAAFIRIAPNETIGSSSMVVHACNFRIRYGRHFLPASATQRGVVL